MAADVKFSVKEAVNNQILTPVSVSEELEQEFIKKSRSAAWKLLPLSIIVSVVVLAIIILVIYFLRFAIISTLALISIGYPAFAVYNIVSTSKAIKKHDYEFLSCEIVGKDDSGYRVRGLETHAITPLIGKKEYNPGEQVIVARLNDELSLISE